jgi:uncharacterized OsmC-like protein
MAADKDFGSRSMAELELAYQARCYSSGTAGRSICNARTHHFVSDSPGGDAPGAGEYFCASMAACAVNMVERIARSESSPLGGMDVHVSLYHDADRKRGRSKDAKGSEVSIYDAARVKFEMWGVSPDDAKFLVKTWKSR